jgi:hypothetical protein
MAYEDFEEYEQELDFEEAGYLEDYEEEDEFEEEYNKLFDDNIESDLDYDRDPVTGIRAKKPKLSALNQSNISSHELDELFLEQ